MKSLEKHDEIFTDRIRRRDTKKDRKTDKQTDGQTGLNH